MSRGACATRVLAVRDLCVSFATRHGTVRAVDGVSFHLDQGETLGLVGESGSGKSVAALALLGLVPRPGRVAAEALELYPGDPARRLDLQRLSARELRALRGDRIALIFQDPLSALNPLLTLGRQLSEVLEIHRGLSHREALGLSARALGEVGLADPEARLAAYPHELSGGMRQRALIAMALLCRPAVLLADEPTTALDVTLQAQILDLLAELQRRHGTAILFVTHDLGALAGRADRVHVMYAGKICEKAGARELFTRPLHPYTRALLASVPRLDGDPGRALACVPGQPPDPVRRPTGCAFEPRCAFAVEDCRREAPPLVRQRASEPADGEEHRAACSEIERVLRGDERRDGGTHAVSGSAAEGERS